MKKSLLSIVICTAIAGGLFSANALSASACSVKKPACQIKATPSVIDADKGETTLSWKLNSSTTKAYLYPKNSTHLIKEVSSMKNGILWMSGISDSRNYIIIVENSIGEKAICDVHIEVIPSKEEKKDEKKVVVATKKHKTDTSLRGYEKYKKYRGSVNKKVYKEIKNWKKNDKKAYQDYKNAYETYVQLSNDERNDIVKGTEYAKYKKYKQYKQYKTYNYYKKRANK
jgi:vacuolar-type H+-ATPase subunit B/Vma2